MEKNSESPKHNHGAEGVKHVSQQKLTEGAYALTKFAEAATPEEMTKLHEELVHAKKTLSAEQYGELLKEMHQINLDDQKANPHLPNLSFFDSSNSGLPDAIRQDWAQPNDKK
jgi:hypothetical protein